MPFMRVTSWRRFAVLLHIMNLNCHTIGSVYTCTARVFCMYCEWNTILIYCTIFKRYFAAFMYELSLSFFGRTVDQSFTYQSENMEHLNNVRPSCNDAIVYSTHCCNSNFAMEWEHHLIMRGCIGCFWALDQGWFSLWQGCKCFLAFWFWREYQENSTQKFNGQVASRIQFRESLIYCMPLSIINRSSYFFLESKFLSYQVPVVLMVRHCYPEDKSLSIW